MVLGMKLDIDSILLIQALQVRHSNTLIEQSLQALL